MQLDVPGKEGSLFIMDKIGPTYSRLGTFLLDDKDGTIMETIKHDHSTVEEILTKVFTRWLTQYRKKNKKKYNTWGILVQTLKIVELEVLAEEIEEILQFCEERENQSNTDRDNKFAYIWGREEHQGWAARNEADCIVQYLMFIPAMIVLFIIIFTMTLFGWWWKHFGPGSGNIQGFALL